MSALRPVSNPPNPWATTTVDYLGEPPPQGLVVYEDDTQSIVSENTSPDLGFRFSVNPYRGCFHGCAYCYARPSHEYLSFGAGSDFERRIVVKRRAPELLRAFLRRKQWRRDLLVFSGVTDCYQPLEASYGLTRGCLEVCRAEATPVHVVTKSPLVERDAELLARLARVARATVSVSIPMVDPGLARAVEPWVTTPQRRLRTIRRLTDAGVEVTVNVAPVIPGLGDTEVSRVLEAARAAGAKRAMMTLLRLPGTVATIFEERLREALPGRAERVLARIRAVRGGRLNDPRFGSRMTGEGHYAQAIRSLFEATCDRLGLERHDPGLLPDPARPSPSEPPEPAPPGRGRQLPLFR